MLALCQKGADNASVDDLGTLQNMVSNVLDVKWFTHLSLREHEPHNQKGLESVVHGDEVEDDVDEGLDKVQESKDDPVGEPIEENEGD